MANRSFVVQYLIRARDRFSQAADRVSRSTEGMRQRIERARESFDRFSERARKTGAILTATVTAPILLMANSFKNSARDAAETESKFATVFRDLSAESQVAAQNLSKNFGLAGTTAKQLLSDTGDLLTGFGFTQESALNLSTQVQELAVDLASFTNFSGGAQGASEALTKALLGEREQLKSLGIAISEAQVKAKILKLISEGQKFASLRQAKAQATLALAIEQSGNAIGDFARTSQDLANQERITSAAVQDLKESFGKLLLPIALEITKVLRSVVQWMTNLSPTTKKIVLIVAALAAALGPLLLIIGSVALVLPILTAGFAALGIVLGIIFSPIGLLIALIALLAVGAAFIITKWDKVKAFFARFVAFVKSKIAPVIDKLTGGLEKIREIRESIAAFSPIEDIKAAFFGADESPAPQIGAASRVDVGVNVGLEKGLRQTTAPAVTGIGARRTDVGMVPL